LIDDQLLDLVVDDTSHLGPTRASFNTLFPRLRPGGVYVIED
jgi:predicted methyltransferase